MIGKRGSKNVDFENRDKTATAILAKKNLGQHYLMDVKKLSFIAKFVSQISDRVIEIGPGTGQLTKYMMEQNCTKLLAVEKDARFMQHLNNIFGVKKQFEEYADNQNIRAIVEHFQMNEERILLINQDILAIDFHDLPDYIMVGNLPYNISAPIIGRFIRHIDKFKHGIFLIQKEVADKICAKCGDREYGRISVFVQSIANARKILNVPPGCFSPPPKVNSEVVHLEINAQYDLCNLVQNLNNIDQITRYAFANPRKTLCNNLSRHFSHCMGNFGDILSEFGLNLNVRPNQIPIEVYVKCSQILNHSVK